MDKSAASKSASDYQGLDDQINFFGCYSFSVPRWANSRRGGICLIAQTGLQFPSESRPTLFYNPNSLGLIFTVFSSQVLKFIWVYGRSSTSLK